MATMDAIDELSAATIARIWPLQNPAAQADKEVRGRVLIVAGSAEIPGAAILAAEGALRAGAGKLTIATGAGIAKDIALAVPESRVIALPETQSGALAQEGAALLAPLAQQVDCLLAGPGLAGHDVDFVKKLLPFFASSAVILDAAAMNAALGQNFSQPVLLTPHAGEMAHLSGDSKEEVTASPMQSASRGAQRWNAIVALKGAETWLATPDGALQCHRGGNAGLAMSGSGDVLAGLIAGFAARGLPLAQAAGWGVVVHACAGNLLSAEVGSTGYLARELLPEIPKLIDRIRLGLQR